MRFSVAAAWFWLASMVFIMPSGALVTNAWQVGGVDTLWTTAGNWTLGHKPTADEQARFPDVGAAFTTLTNILNTTETVDSVLADTSNRDYDWMGTGTLNVSNDFWIKGWTMHNNYIQPTLNLTGRFIVNYSSDGRGGFKFGDAAGYTSGNIFNGGIYNYGRLLYIGGTNTICNTLLVQSSRFLVLSAGYGVTKIDGSSSVFGAGTTFDLRRGGTLWFPATNDFTNVGTLAFNGGMLRLDAASGYIFPTYANGFEVKRGNLGIAGNGTLGATDANGLRLGSTGTFGWLMGGAANSAGNYITRPITLTGNGGFVWVSQYYLNADMNFATDITGPGMLIKTGEKALYLRNAGSGTANSYAGGTAVASGDLWLESARTLGPGNVAIAAGGLLHLTNAAQVGAGANVLVGGNVYNRGILHMLADVDFPTINTNSTGVIALETNNTHALAAVGSAFLGAYNNAATYSAASLPVGAGNTYRIGGLGALEGGGTGSVLLNFDVNGGEGGTGVLTGNNDLLVAYSGCSLRDINTFTGSTTVRNNLQYNAWTCSWLWPYFMSGGSPFGSTTGAVNLYNGGLYFNNAYSVNPSAITKGALNIQGQDVIYIGTGGTITSAVTFASINRDQRGQLSVGASAALGGQAQLYATAAPTPTNGIVAPWFVNGWSSVGTFLNYGATGYTQATYHVTVPAGAFPSLINGTNVVQVTGAATLADNPDIYALRAAAAVTGPTFTNTIRSGGLILNSASTHTANFKFGAAGDVEGIIYATATNTLSGTITTTAGLTKGGPSTLTLTGTNSDTLLGNIVVNGGALTARSDSNLCSAANRVCLNGGAFDGGATVTRTISIGPAGGYLYTSHAGTIVDETPGTPGGPLFISTFNLSLTASNTFTCPLIITGSVRTDGNSTPGKGPVTIKARSCLVIYSSSAVDSTGRYSLQAGNYGAALYLDSGDAGIPPARIYRVGSVEGSGNISFGAYFYPPVNSALVVGNDNTSCDYYGSIMQAQLSSFNYAVVKEGTGTWTLWGDSVWQGPLIVSNGTVEVNGSIESVTSVAVRNGATLGGRGYIGAPVTVDAGGNLAGSLVFATNVTLNANVTNNVTLTGTNAVSQFSQVTINGGTFTLAGCTLKLTLGAVPIPGSTYLILNNMGGTISGQFASGRKVSGMYAGRTYWFSVNYQGGDGNDIVLTCIPSGSMFTIR